MAKFLQELLGNDHPLFVINLHAMEKATGNAGVDTRLIADITEKSHALMRTLQLDPANTHPKELYMALRNVVRGEKGEDLFKDTSYTLAQLDGELVSMNLQDITENSHHELPYEQRVIGHGQRHLRAEIVRRYAEHDQTDHEMIHAMSKEIGLKPEKDEGYHDMNETADKKATILAIGDIFTDAFIMLSEDSARIDTDPDGTKRLSLPYGAKPSYDHVDIVRSVGPSPNAATSCARLGLDVSLMAWVGDDQPGVEAIQHSASEGINTNTMVTQAGAKTSYWYVLRYQADRTMLVKSEKYDYQFKAPATTPEWIYLSYIGEDSWPLHEQLVDYLDQNPDVKLVFQPGTFHFKWGVDRLRDIYKHSHLVVMNREEAMDVTGKGYDDLRELANGVHELGPKIVVITDGPNGSYASFDGKLVTIPNYPDPAPPLDRTGAGDAFASTIVAALAQGESMETALTWAPINSMNVVQKMGAQAGLLHKEDIQHYLETAPAEYKVTEIQ